MLICIDYDQTYTTNPKMWDQVIMLFLESGFEVLCVTMRFKDEGKDLEESIGKLVNIIYTDRKAKLPYLQKKGIYPDVWIDDRPDFILYDATDPRTFPNY